MNAHNKQVFVSYHSDDLDFVQQLARQLSERLPAIDLVYDRLLPPGASFAETLISGINRSDVILAVLSPSYLASTWARQELNVAIERSLNSDTRLIPLLLRPCNPHGYISLLNGIDFTKNQDQALTDLIWGITGERPLGATGDDPGHPTNDIDPDELMALKTGNRLFTSKGNEEQNEVSTFSQPEGLQRCFVMMPFNSSALEYVYENIVSPIAAQFGVCERGDDAFGSNVIMSDIVDKMKSCTYAIADLTGKNANVFYELGICHALGKRVLLLAQSVEDVPFDVRHLRVLLYEYSPPGCDRLKANLLNNLKSMIHSP
jgi:nucleoside 2-deoxyribosyltransferase